MKRCNCHMPPPPPQKGPVQYTPSRLYPDAGQMRHPVPGVVPDAMPAPVMPDMIASPMRIPPRPGPVPPVPIMPPPPPPMPRPYPRPGPVIPEPDCENSKIKAVSVEGSGNIIVEKHDETYKTRYVVKYDGFDERYELIPYTEPELKAICDRLDQA